MRRSNTPMVDGLVSMMPAVCGPTDGLERLEVDVAVGQRRDLAHRAAAHRRGGRIGAVCRVRHDDLDASQVLAGLVVRTNHRDTREFALRTRHRRERDAAHAGHFLQHLLQLEQDLQHALPGRLGRQRMAIEQLRQHRVLVTRLRVVLHRARTERVEVRVDGEIELRQAREVAHRLQLRHFGQQRCRLAPQGGRNVDVDRRVRVLRVGAATRRGLFENQLLMHGRVLRQRPQRCAGISPSAGAYVSMSAGVRVSVAQTSSA